MPTAKTRKAESKTKPDPKGRKKAAKGSGFRPRTPPLPGLAERAPKLPTSAHTPIPTLDLVRREQERRSFARWLPAVSPPPWCWHWRHLTYIREKLDLVTAGDITRLMISVPPQHGKSSLATVRYIAYRIEKDPTLRVILACYDLKHAKKFSRQIRRIVEARGVKLSRERRSVEEWETQAGGYLKAVGVGSGVAGNPADLLVIDDPVKSREEAESQAYRDRVHGWYSEDLYTRLQQNAAVVLIGTRWHDDDLIGRISTGEDAPFWTIINLPAEAEENDPLGRQPGESLCPERFDKKALDDRRRTLGNAYHALYQGRPVPRGGVMFLRTWFTVVNSFDRSQVVATVRFWDLAASTDGDWTVGVKTSRLKGGLFIVEDVQRFRLLAGERDRKIARVAQADGPNVRVWAEEEPGSAGKAVTLSLVRLLAGYVFHAEKATGDKEVRAEPWASQLQGDNVRLLKGHWTYAFVEEHCVFPHGKYDDQVDAASGCLNKLAGPGSVYLERGLTVLDGGGESRQRKSVMDLVNGTPMWVNPDSDDWLVDDD